MKLDLTRYAPPGIHLRQETKLYITGMVCAALYRPERLRINMIV